MRMTKEQFMQTFPQHAHLVGAAKEQAACISETLGASKPVPNGILELPKGKRIRQRTKRLLNDLETEFLHFWLLQYYTKEQIHAQRFQLLLANGLRYKPDFVTITGGGMTLWEVKGPHAYRGGFENLKSAASLFIGVKCILVWKKDGIWTQQEVLP